MPDQNHDQPDMDLISMVQRARQAYDAEANPSDVPAVYWIEAPYTGGDANAPTPRSGQWVLTVDVTDVDSLWAQVKAATEAGKLGYKSKVSTASNVEGQSNLRVIAVRTYDADDEADVKRVRDALAEITGEADWRYQRD